MSEFHRTSVPPEVLPSKTPVASSNARRRPTNFARLSPTSARVVLLLTALSIAGFFTISLSVRSINFAAKPRGGPGDVDLYWAEIGRIAQGESYYQAANQELRPRGYPTRSVFNWRTPLPIWLIGVLPKSAGHMIIGMFAALLMAMAVHLAAREGTVRSGLLCGLLLSGALMPCWLDEIYIMPVIWAGVFIGLSICSYAIGRRGWGVGCGLAAVVLRELAGPYCVVCLLLAAYERRWKEVLAWTLGLFAYFGFYTWHYFQVMALVGPHDPAHTEGWLQMNGAAFVLAIAQMNTFLLLLPQWVTAIFLPLAIVGFASWSTPTGQRAGLTVCTFIILFAFVGQPFNQYWGSLVAPLFCLGAARAPAALADLVRCAADRTVNYRSVAISA